MPRTFVLSEDRELLLAALPIFAAVSLATGEFIKHSFFHVDAVRVPKSAVVYTIILLQALPAVALLAADRIIDARERSGKALRIFRTAVFAAAILMILRELQLYWGPGVDLAEMTRSASPLLLIFAGLGAVVGVVWLSWQWFKGVALFFLYMSPVAIAMAAVLPFQVPTADALPDGYAREVVTATKPQSKPAVFILIFDELAYEVLAEDGNLDEERFPNFAAIAQGGVWFTNATSNYFRTRRSTPYIIGSAADLTDEFNVRLYLQYLRVEGIYLKGCGKEYTCRGARYLAENNQLALASDLALRSLYETAPETVEPLINGPAGWLVAGLDTAYPQVDDPGYQVFSKKIFDMFLDDIEGREALGRISVLHLLLPHAPFAFDEDGNAIGAPHPRSADALWDRYREQTMFTDRLLGSLIEKLKDEGIYDDSVVVVTSDHGRRGVVPSAVRPVEVSQRMVQVPLLIRAPDLRGLTLDVDYQHIDFASTLRDVLGLPQPEASEGVSAFSQQRPQRDKVFHVDDWTYVYDQEEASWRVRQDSDRSGNSANQQ